jgi:hypothetical protein
MACGGMGVLGYSAMVISFGTTSRNEDMTYPKTCVTLILRNAYDGDHKTFKLMTYT